jgi:hypothetical protein
VSGAGVDEDDATFLVVDEIPNSSASRDLQLPPRQDFALERARGEVFTLEWVLSVVPPARIGAQSFPSASCISWQLAA